MVTVTGTAGRDFESSSTRLDLSSPGYADGAQVGSFSKIVSPGSQ
jgi:hypothetical protein